MADVTVPNRQISEFLGALGQRTPSPGGGATAALAGALGAAQLLMAAEYSAWDGGADPRESLKAIVKALPELAERELEMKKKVGNLEKPEEVVEDNEDHDDRRQARGENEKGEEREPRRRARDDFKESAHRETTHTERGGTELRRGHRHRTKPRNASTEGAPPPTVASASAAASIRMSRSVP